MRIFNRRASKTTCGIYAILAAATLLAVAGCASPIPEEPGRATAEEAARAFIRSVSSYETDMTMAIRYRTVSRGQTTRTTRAGTRTETRTEPWESSDDSSGIVQGTLWVDVGRKAARHEFESSGDEGYSVRSTVYIMRGKIYQRLTGSDYSGEWTKNRLSVDGWQQFNHLEFLVMWLRHAKVEVVGEETVGGRDSFVLRLHPSTPDFWPILLREGGSVPLVRDGKLDPVQRDFIKSATATWWVDKQTFAFTRMRVAIGLEWREAQRSASGPATQLSRQPVPQGEFGKVPSGKDWAIDTVIEFHPRAYNQPVMVVLPPEAWQAIEGLVFPLR